MGEASNTDGADAPSMGADPAENESYSSASQSASSEGTLLPLDTPDFRECKECGRIARFRPPDGAAESIDIEGAGDGEESFFGADL